MHRTKNTSPSSRGRIAQFICVAIATSTAFIASPSAEAQANAAPRTITHPLSISKHPTAALSNSDADSIIGSSNNILGQCRAVFTRQGNVASSAAMPSAIYSATDMANACSASMTTDDATIAGAPRRVRVVNNIFWCGSPTTTTIGCAYTPGTCLVVVRHSLDGILWAHEFGHSKGLPHRQDVDAVMHGTINEAHRVFSSSECQAIRQLGLTAFDGAPMEHNPAVRTPIPIQEFVTQDFVHGVPYDEARLYTSADSARIAPWLSDSSKISYADNVATTIGIIADGNAYALLRQALFAAGSGQLTIDQYNARAAALMSLGYVVKGNGSAQARQLLETRTNPASWSDIGWMAPYHQTEAERNDELAALAAMGLSLAGDEKALAFLKAVDIEGLKSKSEVTANALQQAIDDLERSLFESAR